MKPATLILLSLILSLTLAQKDKCENPLASLFKFKTLKTPKEMRNTQFCSNIEGGISCCNQKIINRIPQDVNYLDKTFGSYFTSKDLAEYLTQFDFEGMQERFSHFEFIFPLLHYLNPDLDKAFREFLKNLREMIPDIRDYFRKLNETYNDSYDDRKKCWDTLLSVQASSYCMACDPKYAESEERKYVVIDKDLCARLHDECYTLLEKDPLFSDQELSKRFMERLLGLFQFLSKLKLDRKDAILQIKLNLDKLPLQQLLTSSWNCSDVYVKIETLITALLQFRSYYEQTMKSLSNAFKEIYSEVTGEINAEAGEMGIIEGAEGMEFEQIEAGEFYFEGGEDVNAPNEPEVNVEVETPKNANVKTDVVVVVNGKTVYEKHSGGD
jgi:hypothetical protein